MILMLHGYRIRSRSFSRKSLAPSHYLALCHVPGNTGEPSALTNSSETDLTIFLVSSFTSGSPTKWSIQEHLLQLLS